MNIRKWIAVGLVAAAMPAFADDAPKCKLVRLANWHVRLLGTHPVLDGYVNGKKIGVVIDTGAFTSLLTKAAAERLGLATHSSGETVYGVGGGASRMLLARIDELQIGDFSAKGFRVRVAGERPFRGMDFILGQDFLQSVDVEFDYAHGAVRLYQPLDCKDRALSYWDPDAQRLPLSGSREDIIPVTVNGRKADALIDSGGGDSMVQLAFAQSLGITPSSPGVAPAACAFGLGSGMVHQWVAGFESIALGEETIRNPHLHFGELNSDWGYYRSSGPDLMLGGDFLKAHHVLISHSQGKVYITYSGGQVFPATAALECDDERVRGKSPKEALAVYDEILAKEPSDARTLLFRSNLRYSQKDLQGALSDLDAALQVDAANPVAHVLRSRVRVALKDYDGALADSDAAMANGMRNSGMYVYRAGLRRAKGDRAGMLAEFDEALKLDPHDTGALRTRGRYLYLQGKYAAAEEDFKAVLAIRPDAFDSIWLHLARARQGGGEPRALEDGLGQLKDGEWPAPVMQYLLGRIDGEALMKIASADEKARKGRECEARFYWAERSLIAGKNDEARPLLESARDACPLDFIEHDSALIELDRMK